MEYEKNMNKIGRNEEKTYDSLYPLVTAGSGMEKVGLPGGVVEIAGQHLAGKT